MSNIPRDDNKMLESNFFSTGKLSHNLWNKSLRKNLQEQKNQKILEKYRNLLSILGTDEMDDLDIFLTLILKNLTANERFLLLNLLSNVNWDNSDESLDDHLREVINKKNKNEDLQNTFNYDHFLWEFRNWKNFFLSKK